MTALYGSKAQPKKVFGEGKQLQIFYDVMLELAPLVWKLNEDFLTMWDPTKLSNDWVLPDNYHVHVKVMGQVSEVAHFLNEPYEIIRNVNAPAENGRSLGANTIHSIDGMIVREMARRCNYDPKIVERVRNLIYKGKKFLLSSENATKNAYMTQVLWEHFKKSGYLSARILDYIDYNTILQVNEHTILQLIESLPAKPFPILSIHDCFRCHPNYGNDLRKQYMLQLHLIAKSNMLNYLLSQITGRPSNRVKGDPTLADDILNSEYALS